MPTILNLECDVKTRCAALALSLVVVLAACESSKAKEEAMAAVPEKPAPNLRTADLAERGLTEADFPHVTKLAENVYVYSDLKGNGGEDRARAEKGLPPVRFTVNNMFVVTPEGVLLADDQPSPEMTKRMLAEIAKITDKPITHYVVGADKYSQTGGNDELPKGVKVYAHPTSAAVLTAKAKARTNEPLSQECQVEGGTNCPGARLLPTDLVPDKKVLNLGGEEIQILHLGRARTGGDLFVYLPKERIFFGSQAFMAWFFPALSGGFPSEWVDVMKKMEALNADIYVPGHGFITSPAILKEALDAQLKDTEEVIAEATRLHQAGASADQAAEQAKFPDLAKRTLQLSQLPGSVKQVYTELDGKLPKAPTK